MRLAISAAAALVKVRHRIDSGRAPLQQQAEDARGQHLRLASARRSRERGVDVRVRGERLLVLQGGKWLETRAHAASQAALKAIEFAA